MTGPHLLREGCHQGIGLHGLYNNISALYEGYISRTAALFAYGSRAMARYVSGAVFSYKLRYIVGL